MKVLFVGGIYHVEFSLFHEARNNPDLTVKFCTFGYSFEEYASVVNPTTVSNRGQIDAIKANYLPDLTIFRNWNASSDSINDTEVLWQQEIFATLDDNTRPKDIPTCRLVAHQSKVYAEQHGLLWLPYCASEYWGVDNPTGVRDIAVAMATNLPPDETGGLIKRRSMDILIKPIIEWNPGIVNVYAGLYGGFERVPYLAPCIKPSYRLLDVTKTLSRVQIYLSPTTIWYDEGCVSQKTYEAMACGCLVMTNRYVGIEAVLGKDGENLIYANTPEESLEKVKYYLEHSKEREEIAERGRRFITTEYSWMKHLTRLAQDVAQR